MPKINKKVPNTIVRNTNHGNDIECRNQSNNKNKMDTKNIKKVNAIK